MTTDAAGLATGWELTDDLGVIATFDDGLSFVELAQINAFGELTRESALEHGRVIAAAQSTLWALENLLRWVEVHTPAAGRLAPEILAARGAVSIARGHDAGA